MITAEEKVNAIDIDLLTTLVKKYWKDGWIARVQNDGIWVAANDRPENFADFESQLEITFNVRNTHFFLGARWLIIDGKRYFPSYCNHFTYN